MPVLAGPTKEGNQLVWKDAGQTVGPAIMTPLMEVNAHYPFYLMAASTLVNGVIYFWSINAHSQ
jgi:hypothetical protein